MADDGAGTGAEAGSSKVAEFDYSELETVSTEESVMEQKVRLSIPLGIPMLKMD